MQVIPNDLVQEVLIESQKPRYPLISTGNFQGNLQQNLHHHILQRSQGQNNLNSQILAQIDQKSPYDSPVSVSGLANSQKENMRLNHEIDQKVQAAGCCNNAINDANKLS